MFAYVDGSPLNQQDSKGLRTGVNCYWYGSFYICKYDVPPVFLPDSNAELPSSGAGYISFENGCLLKIVQNFTAPAFYSLVLLGGRTCPPCKPYPAGTIGYREPEIGHSQ